MEGMQMEELTSGASGRIIPVFKNLRRAVPSYDALRRSITFIHSIFVWMIIFVRPRQRYSTATPSPPTSPVSTKKRKFVLRRDEEDTLRRRALAEALQMVVDGNDDGDLAENCRWSTLLFHGVRRNALFCRSWFPVSSELNIFICHGQCFDELKYDDGSFISTCVFA